MRITGSDNDQSATRAQCVNMPNARSFRTFQGFMMDTCTGSLINLQASSNSLIVQDCYLNTSAANLITITGTGTGTIVRRCYIIGRGNGAHFTHSATVDNAAHFVESCIFIMGGGTNGVAVRVDRVGGITVRNCAILAAEVGLRVQTALTVGQVLTVNNCILHGCNTAVQATTTAEFVEDYNCFWANGTDRGTVNAGANSVAYPPLFDPRWFFQTVYGGAGPSDATQVINPFDLAPYSQLVDKAGTSPTTTDMRGTAVQGSQREWGPLEYDSTLKIEGGSAGGGGPLIDGRLVR